MPKYIADSYLYRAVGADIGGACGKCAQSRSDCMCHSLSRMDICGIIDDAPTADVQEMNRGKWKMQMLPRGVALFYCSECGFGKYTEDNRAYGFCPNCGADMREENDNG